MIDLKDLLEATDHLPAAEKRRLVRRLLSSLEHEQADSAEPLAWHDFLQATYGSLSDTPIQRWEQGAYEEREPLQ